MRIPGSSVDVHVGMDNLSEDQEPIDWRSEAVDDGDGEAEPDDPDETPEDVIAILGFDPSEEDTEGEDDDD